MIESATLLLTPSVGAVARTTRTTSPSSSSSSSNAFRQSVFTLLALILVTARPSSGQSAPIRISPWWIPEVIPYPDLEANVGDQIEFQWVGVHNVFIHPSGDCAQTGRIAVGNISPVVYTFTEDDAGKTLTFACDVRSQSGTSGTHCEFGMRFDVFVIPDSPIAPPTEIPVEIPTDAPVAPDPTGAPVAPDPTEAPVAPTETPVVPTEAPVVPPTEAPVAPPTDAPVAPTASPTTAPPVDDPTAAPVTEAPVTEAPVAPDTDSPTDIPTIAPTTGSPSDSPTEYPTSSDGLVETTVSGLQMGLVGIEDFPPDTATSWEDLTRLFSRSQNARIYNGTLLNYTTAITVTDFFKTSGRRQQRYLKQSQEGVQGERFLQSSVIFVEYDQFIRYRVLEGNDDIITPDVLATSPFETSAQRSSYQNLLNLQGDPFLEQISDVTPVFLPDEPTIIPTPTAAPTPDEGGGGLSTGAIIGIAVGGGVLLLGALGGYMYMRGGKSSDTGRNAGTETAPPTTITGSKSINGDDVSTLPPPDVRGGPMGDQSVGTVDYDYSKAYGVTGDGTVSSAGGTFGSNTFNQTAYDPGNALATGAALGSSDVTGSFRDHFRNPNANVKEELIHIFAPPGKLGVVIDTPDDGAPMIHAVKDSSVIADKIQVDDKLVAVDDEDVRQMTAITVSKLISHKSANPSRKLTVLRTTVIE
eukprot:CAMPEP_0113490886 /NCGR_PEP_ID=MMETSP0014_2-20120614/27275_1 /TAXON_ID=2857 /ORGANISM="Nitzschia sp." /LENGTH=695 /DNA_ID=CAMNT_0000384667 /DNA_START=230 /DNA_END=2317 /DNA_ORIENTATION=+ /assembly_acc=CAM_ASM_000159